MAFDLLEALLETEALRLSPPGKVFWYTSGTVGPYYINTENVYGGPAGAGELLAFIDSDNGEADFPFRLRERVEKQYAGNAIYRQVIDALVAKGHGWEDLKVKLTNRKAGELFGEPGEAVVKNVAEPLRFRPLIQAPG